MTLDIQADPEEFAKAMDRAFRRVTQRVNIPGFRPGKAPRIIIEQRLGRDVIVEEAHGEIMDTLYRQALEQEEIVPVSEPVVNIYQAEPVGFTVDIEVYPEVDLGDYRSLRVEPREVTVTDEDLEKALADIQRAHSLWVEPEEARTPREGDQVTINLSVTRDGEPFQEPLEDGVFVLGESGLFPQIEEALKNLHPGESAEFEITFDEDDATVNPELRGHTLQYALTLNEIKERELPAIDDELAKTVGDYETLEELRAATRKNLLQARAVEARGEVVTAAVDTLAEAAELAVPSAMIERQLDDEIERLRSRLAQQGASLEEYLRFENMTEEEYRQNQRPEAERRLRNSLVLEAFAKAEEIEVSEDDLFEEIERLTGASENPEQMREIYSSPYFRQMLTEELTNRKVTDRLLELLTDGQGPVTGEGAEALKELETPASAETAASEEAAEAVAEMDLAEAEPVTDEPEADEADEADEAEVTAEAEAPEPAAEPAVEEPTDENEPAEPEREG